MTSLDTISPEALNAFFNATANLTLPFGKTEEGETAHVIYVYAIIGGSVLEVRHNPRTTRNDSVTEFGPQSEEAWIYLDMISREGRLLA